MSSKDTDDGDVHSIVLPDTDVDFKTIRVQRIANGRYGVFILY